MFFSDNFTAIFSIYFKLLYNELSRSVSLSRFPEWILDYQRIIDSYTSKAFDFEYRSLTKSLSKECGEESA